MDIHRSNHEQLLKGVGMGFQRYLLRQIKWDKRLIGIFGANGVGKTTLVLQHIKSAFGDSGQALYLSLDSIWFQDRKQFPVTVAEFYEAGGTHLFLDNVQQYDNWLLMIGRFCSTYPNLNIVFIAPSALSFSKIQKALTVQITPYTLNTMSFREYLSYEGAMDLKPVPLDELLLNYAEISSNVIEEVNVVPIFRNYLEHGCYPFYWDDPDAFFFRLQDLIRDSIDMDFAPAVSSDPKVLRRMKLLILELAKLAPKMPRMQDVPQCDGEDFSQAGRLAEALEEMGWLRVFTEKGTSGPKAVKRSFLGNTNLQSALFLETDRIYSGEIFFIDQMANIGEVEWLGKTDYRVNDKYSFIIGDPLMDYDRIKGVENSFAAIHGQPKSLQNKMPIWVLGLCY